MRPFVSMYVSSQKRTAAHGEARVISGARSLRAVSRKSEQHPASLIQSANMFWFKICFSILLNISQFNVNDACNQC